MNVRPADADKENGAPAVSDAKAPHVVKSLGSFMRPTASSKQRTNGATNGGGSGGGGGDHHAAHGLAATLRPNLNVTNVGARFQGASTARGAAHRPPPASPPKQTAGGPGSSAAARAAARSTGSGVADLKSFRARLDVVRRESMMRQSMSAALTSAGAIHHQPPSSSSAMTSAAPTVAQRVAHIENARAAGDNHDARHRSPAVGGVAEAAPVNSVNPHCGARGEAGEAGEATHSFPLGASSGGMAPSSFDAIRESFGGDAFGFGSGSRGDGGRDGVQALHRQIFEDPNFIDAVEKCLNFRSKAPRGSDMKTVKEEARETTNMLKQTVNALKQSLVRKEALVEELTRLERDREQAADGLRLQTESANATAAAAERELEALKKQLAGATSAAAAAGEEAATELRRVRESAEWDARRAADDYDAKVHELSSLRRRHEESQETLRATRADLAAAREAAARAEREQSALRRECGNRESAWDAERRALEGQIRAKVEEMAAERVGNAKARSEHDERLRELQARIETLAVQNASLVSAAAEATKGGKEIGAQLSAKVAAVEGELEAATRALSRERLQRDGVEAELNRALEASRGRVDELEAELRGAAVSTASLKEKLAAAMNGAADAAVEAEDLVAAKAAEIAALTEKTAALTDKNAASTEEIAALTERARSQDEALAALAAELTSTAETAERLTDTLASERGGFEEERASSRTALERARAEAEAHRARVESLMEALMEAREKAEEDMAREKTASSAALVSAREKAAFEVQTARDAAAASLAAAAAAATSAATSAAAEKAALEKRVEDTREEAAALEAALAATREDLEATRREKVEAQEEVATLIRTREAASREMTAAEERRAELLEQAATIEARLAGVVAQLESERSEVDRLEREAAAAREAAKTEAAAREAAAKAAAAERADTLSELRALRAAAGIGDDGEELDEVLETRPEMSGRDASALTARLVKATKAAEAAKRIASDLEEYKRIAAERATRIEALEAQAMDADAIRRALHNQIQELRGNVRVFCRVRPATSERSCVECSSDGDGVTLTRSFEGDGQGGGQSSCAFEFDRVFGPASTQGEVFEEVSQLVQSALDGYKVCLFSYGQTGSGKTHTMLGDQHDADARGIIPRAVAKVVEASRANAKKGWTYQMRASYVEIYNEQVRDLLKAGSGHSDKHSIVHTADGVTEVSGVQREPVSSVEAAAGLVRRAAAARAVEATQMNAVSSRSHTIFMLYITGEHEGSGTRLAGCLNLVDLAGSERVGRSGAEGARLKEACAINKSLSCLGDVFQALAKKQSHVPYRNSKLTYLLQPCLGGDGKTLMFVNINPEAPSAEESLCSLKFASQVNAVELGRGGAKRNVTSGMSSRDAGDGGANDDRAAVRREAVAAANAAKAALGGAGKRKAAGPGSNAHSKHVRR